MHRINQVLFVLFILLFSVNVAVAAMEASEAVAVLVQQAQTKELASHPYWMRLLYYRKLNKASRVVSEIISPDFFLSSQGATEPAAELAATLAAFFDEPDKEPDRHAQCRFVARYQWLRKNLDWGSIVPPLVTCRKFIEWSQQGQVESLSLIFATGYLDNPASFYGHLLLKFNNAHATRDLDLLDQTINYGAIVPKNELGLVYIFKGLFGGYDAGFSHERFYHHNHVYGENELRDMWEYELALTKDQINQVIAHSWELLGNKFIYYFVNRNCAYRMEQLLELVIDEPLSSPNMPWSIPVSVFDRLALMKQNNGAPIVRTVRWIPSRQNRYYAKYSKLNPLQQQMTQALVKDGLNFENPVYREMWENDKIAIVDTLLDYYEFRIIHQDSIAFKQAKHKLLIERAGLAAQTSSANEIPTDAAAPRKGTPPSMVRLGLLQNSQWGSGVELRLRPAYYDFLALDTGHLPNSNLTMFDLRVAYADDRFRFRSFDIVNVETFNLSRTSLPGDGGLAWKFKFGFENQDLSCNDCVIFNIVGGTGKATSLGPLTVYAMVDLHAQTKHQGSGTLGATPRLGILGSPTTAWKSQFTVGQRTYLNSSKTGTHLVQWENRIGSDRNRDIRVNYEKNIKHELQVAISFYW